MKKTVILLSFLLTTLILFSTIINVPGDQATIQDGIDVSSNGDIVLVQPGIYYGSINYWSKEITVCSLYNTTQDTSYITQTIIDGNNYGTVVSFIDGESNNSVLSGFTIRNGNAQHGGGLLCIDASPALENLVIRNNQATDGGGIYCCNYANPSLDAVTISNNTASMAGGGIFCLDYSETDLTNVKLMNNHADEYGGAYYGVNYSGGCFIHVEISGNSSLSGGGVFCYGDSSPSFNYVNIINNTAISGGGLYFGYDCTPLFSSSHLCNIYSNSCSGRGNGSDIYLDEYIEAEIFVDTFTVMNPTDHHAYPIENYEFSILSSVYEQVEADLYVSPEGDNMNSGLTPSEALKSISFATSIIISDSLNPHTINLLGGTYSPSVNNEFFPINIPDNTSLIGVDQSEVIIDAESSCGGIFLNKSINVRIANLTITNGSDIGGIFCNYCDAIIENVTLENNVSSSRGGGIYLQGSDSLLRNVTIRGNIAQHGGGIHFFHSSAQLINVEITDNYAITNGGGVYFTGSDPILANVTIADNIGTQGGGAYFPDSQSSPLIINSILWDNAPQQIYFSTAYANSSELTLAFTNIEGGLDEIVYDENITINWLEGNIDEEPLWFNSGSYPYSLLPDSPCIDAGTLGLPEEIEIPEIDLAGNPRIYGDTIDLGAYEWQEINSNNENIIANKTLDVFPNPFNPVTRISFSLTETERISLEIFNIKGQKLKTLLDEKRTAGEYEFVWNAEDYASGVYFIRMKTNTYQQLKTAVLLK